MRNNNFILGSYTGEGGSVVQGPPGPKGDRGEYSSKERNFESPAH